MRGAAFTAVAAGLAWAAWTYSAWLAEISGLHELDVLIQLASVFVVLALAERLFARLA